MKRLFVLSMALLFASGCFIVRGRRPVMMTQREALSAALTQCQWRGYTCRVKEMHRTGDGIWKVKFAAHRGAQRGHLHLDLDAWTGEVVKVNDKMHGGGKGGGPPPGRGRGHKK